MLIGIVFGSYYAIQSRVGATPVTLWTQVRKAIQTAAETRTAQYRTASRLGKAEKGVTQNHLNRFEHYKM